MALFSKKKLVQFAKAIGYEISEDAILDVKADETKVDEPVTPEKVETEVDEVLKTNNTPPPPQTPVQQPPVQPTQASNIPLLDQLINDLGGFEAFKAVMLKVLNAQNNPQGQTPAQQPVQNVADKDKEPVEVPDPKLIENKKREDLVAVLVANAKNGFTAKELEMFTTPMLEKLSTSLEVPEVDYSGLGSSAVKANKQEFKRAPRPSFLLQEVTQ